MYFDVKDGYSLKLEKDDPNDKDELVTDVLVREWRNGGEGNRVWLKPWGSEFPTYWKGLSGRIPLIMQSGNCVWVNVQIQVVVKLRKEAFRSWQVGAWRKIRDAAEAQYYENRQSLIAKRDALLAKLGEQDALSLRKREREEIMKGGIRWLLGPEFRFVPQGYPQDPDDLYQKSDHDIYPGSIKSTFGEKDKKEWKSIPCFGEKTIQFLNHAVEWENRLYFLYPYFWSHPGGWVQKRDIDHPDFTHRAFLKAGSARVVLTIRPGFEEAFTRRLAAPPTGEMEEELPAEYPYFTIASEMRAYAQTNFPGIPAANVDVDARPLLLPEQREAWKRMQVLIQHLEEYKHEKGLYPTKLDELPSTGGTLELKDPWGHAFHYKSPGLRGEYDLASYGSNGEPGGEGADADITSWAEGSLIATWNEYTPTSALDIRMVNIAPGS